jgi:hypothetical protein
VTFPFKGKRINFPFFTSKQLTMRPNPRKPKSVLIGLAVNHNHIRLDVAVAESFVRSCQRMVAIFDWERFVRDQQR